MTKLIFLFILLFSQEGFGQTGELEISGKVFSHPAPYYDKYDTLLIDNVTVKLKFNDSLQLNTSTDKNGRYSFKYNSTLGSATLIAETNRLSGIKFDYMCGFLSPRFIHTIDDKNISKSSYDFYVTPINCCLAFPEFHYNKNDIKPSGALMTTTTISVDSALHLLVNILTSKFYVAIELNGHADSKETEPNQLSIDRVNYLINYLTSQGIDKNRLTGKSYGSSQPINRNTIGESSSSKSFKSAELNRRVAFKVLRLDFGVKMRAYLENEDDE